MSFALALTAIDAARPLLDRPFAGKPPRPTDIDEKAAHDYVTELDVAIERAVAAVIHAAHPDHQVWGEEVFTDADRHAPDVWYLDPIDGTRNLLAGRPEVAVSLAWYHHGAPAAAAIWLPCRDLLVAAEPDTPGLIVNGRPFTPPPAPPLDRALVGLAGDIRADTDAALFTHHFGRLANRFEGVRIAGALGYDLACMALGELDARLSHFAKPVDIAAGAFLVAHTGGVMSTDFGDPYDLHEPGIAIARSAALHAALVGP